MAESDRLAKMSRPELIARATELGVGRAERMTRLELVDEIARQTKKGAEQVEARGLFGVARAMVADVMERGLNLPDAAALIRGTAHLSAKVEPRVPVATVTLAEIYAAQGHQARALRILDSVLADEPEHAEAQRLRVELARGSSLSAPAADATGAPVSVEYEPQVEWETTGEKIKTGEPPPVEEKPDQVFADPRYATVELKWSGSTLLADFTLAQPEARDYCLAVVGFEMTLGRPIRQEARYSLGRDGEQRLGQIRCAGFAGSSVCAALGFVDAGERFIPLATGPILRPEVTPAVAALVETPVESSRHLGRS
jgi:predicted XRE-type DNA-binding protein